MGWLHGKMKGFSLIEVILAMAIFIILAGGTVVAVLSGLDANRLAGDVSVATQFASEGLEAMRSIKNQSYNSLINTTGTGVVRTDNVWGYGGTTNTFDNGRYTRVITVSNVQRDASGNIVASGGILDTNTKKITSQVTWMFSPTRSEEVTLSTYFTNWKAPIIGDGLLVYDNGSTTPQYRLYDNDSFSSASSTIAGSSGRFFEMKTSPIQVEAIVGYVTDSGVLQIMCFDGIDWTKEWSVSVGGNGTTRPFSLAYETTSGDVLVVYATGSSSTNALSYRTKSGTTSCGSTNWSAETNFAASPAVTSGTVQWVTMARNPVAGSDMITVIWADTNADLGVNNWSGNAWASGGGTVKSLETDLERINTPQDVDNFAVVYESISGNAMVVWGTASGGDGSNGARYARCTGNTFMCSWTGTASIPSVSDDVHNLDMKANPTTNEIVYAAIGDDGDDLTAGYWSGSSWTGYANIDRTTESPFSGSKLVATLWLVNGATSRWIITYDDRTGQNLSWYAAAPGSSPIRQTDFNASPKIGNLRERYDADTNPFENNKAMVTLTNESRSLFAKQVSMDDIGAMTWSNADGGASLGTTTAVPQQGFLFQYWRNPQ